MTKRTEARHDEEEMKAASIKEMEGMFLTAQLISETLLPPHNEAIIALSILLQGFASL